MQDQYFSDYEKEKRKEQSDTAKKIEHEKLQQLEERLIVSKIKVDINELKSLIIEWYIDINQIDNVLSWDSLENNDILTIFSKIEEVEELLNIDKILPKEYRITKTDYLSALKDKNDRDNTISKIEQALLYLHQSYDGGDSLGLSLFKMYFFVLNKNLVLVQENYIDIKNNLIDK